MTDSKYDQDETQQASDNLTEVTPVAPTVNTGTPTTADETVLDDTVTPDVYPHERDPEPYTTTLDAEESAADYEADGTEDREGEHRKEA